MLQEDRKKIKLNKQQKQKLEWQIVVEFLAADRSFQNYILTYPRLKREILGQL